jgi:cytochrome P450
MKKVGVIGALNTTFPLLSKLSRTIPLPFFASITDASKRLVTYSEKALERYKRVLDADPEHPPPTLFTKLFHAGEEGLPDAVLSDEARGYIIAGSDTTAVSLTYLVWAVCSNEKIKATLVNELASLPENFQDSDIRNFVFLNQVIDETLRVYSAAPSALPRVVPPGGAVLAGKFIPAGVIATTQAYSLHRNQEIFPDPERLAPTNSCSVSLRLMNNSQISN